MKDPGFFENVYDVVREIPAGRVSTYGAIAHYLGAKGSARMVGWAMNAAHTLGDVPAHRVVNHQGLLTGKHHFSSPERMQQLLEAEGVEISNDRIVGFKTCFWDPSEHLL